MEHRCPWPGGGVSGVPAVRGVGGRKVSWQTHHYLWEGLQRGLELVSGRQGVWEVHGPGQDEQRGRDLLVQVQLQPLELGVQDPDSPAGLLLRTPTASMGL